MKSDHGRGLGAIRAPQTPVELLNLVEREHAAVVVAHRRLGIHSRTPPRGATPGT
jgi:hypothetical protein